MTRSLNNLLDINSNTIVSGTVDCDTLNSVDINNLNVIDSNFITCNTITVDSNLLNVNGISNKIGIGTTNPDYLMQIFQSSGDSNFSIKCGTTLLDNARILLGSTSDPDNTRIQYNGLANQLDIIVNGGLALTIANNQIATFTNSIEIGNLSGSESIEFRSISSGSSTINFGGGNQISCNLNTDTIDITTNSVVSLSIDNSSNVNITGNIVAGNLLSASWTPTLTSVNGISGSPSNISGLYIRVGNVVYCSLSFDLTTTGSSGNWQVSTTLPIASNFTTSNDAIGNILWDNDVSIGANYIGSRVGSRSATDDVIMRMNFDGVISSVSKRAYCNFSYIII